MKNVLIFLLLNNLKQQFQSYINCLRILINIWFFLNYYK